MPNEYQTSCREQDLSYCLTDGTFNSTFAVHGSLKLLMLIAAAIVTVGVFVVTLFLPETLRPTQATQTGLWKHLEDNWREVRTPWTNLRCMATPTLKLLLVSLSLVKVTAVAAMACQKSFLMRRHGLDSFNMTVLS